MSPVGETGNVALDLKSESHVEVFGHVRLGPEHVLAVFHGGDVLQGGPAEDCVVTDKGCDVSIGDAVVDSSVDEIREEGNAVFEVVVRHLHHSGGKLKDGYFWRLFHLTDSVEQTVFGYLSIGVNCVSKVSHESSR